MTLLEAVASTGTEVEHIAVWFGLVLAIVGIVLSAVAILFTWVVNRRADALNDRTIEALTKIENDVARISDDVRGLIRDAWTRMLIPVPDSAQPAASRLQHDPHVSADGSTESIAPTSAPSDGAMRERADPYARVVDMVQRLSPQAKELLRVLYDGQGLTDQQYTRLRKTELGPPLYELTQSGLVAWYADYGIQQDRFFRGVPPHRREAVRIALSLIDEAPRSVKSSVSAGLAKAGYGVSPTDSAMPIAEQSRSSTQPASNGDASTTGAPTRNSSIEPPQESAPPASDNTHNVGDPQPRDS